MYYTKKYIIVIVLLLLLYKNKSHNMHYIIRHGICFWKKYFNETTYNKIKVHL